MIKECDKIAVGVSAGKDSLTLLCAMAALKRFYPVKFELEAITVDMGFEKSTDYSQIAELCRSLDVPYTVVPSDIAKIVFDIRKEPNPCSLCAKLRRGALNNAAKERGCTTVALGHHWDDAVTYLSRVDLTVIRPMLYMPEKTVSAFAKQANLPVITSSCPADKSTEREQIKALLQEYEHRDPRYRGLRNRIFNAMQKSGLDGFKLPERRLPAFAEEAEQLSESIDTPENSD